MPRNARPLFSCLDCGASQPRWSGRCPACGAWNRLVEEATFRPRGARGRGTLAAAEARPLGSDPGERDPRLATGVPELDRLLGGGLAAGAVYLLGGEPGIGKSTLLLQIAVRVSAECPGLYVAAEEAPARVDARASRLGLEAPGLDLLGTVSLEVALEALERKPYGFVAVDSIQLLRSEAQDGTPGSVGQVRECAARLAEAAREKAAATVLVSHVTKDGALAGPKTLEHVVDAVLEFEGDAQRDLRVLRCSKNRYGSADEVAVFAMTGAGLEVVADPAREFLAHGPSAESPSGCAATCLLEGSQPLFLEVQALVARSAYGTPQRVAQGLDARRLSLLLAVLERRAGIVLGGSDVFVKVAGGLELREPVADLAVAVALAGSHADRPVPRGWLFVGEIGLGGELRPVPRVARRLEEAARLGFRGVVAAASDDTRLAAPEGLRLEIAEDLVSALGVALGRVETPRSVTVSPTGRPRPAGVA